MEAPQFSEDDSKGEMQERTEQPTESTRCGQGKETSANLPNSFEVKKGAFLPLIFLFFMTGILFTCTPLLSWFYVQILKTKIAYVSQRSMPMLWPA